MPKKRNNHIRREVKRGGIKRHTANARRPHASLTDLRGGCPVFTNKVRYRDHREAVGALHHLELLAAAEIAATGRTNHNECRAHRCAHCKGYHLTSWETPTSGPAINTAINTQQNEERQAA